MPESISQRKALDDLLEEMSREVHPQDVTILCVDDEPAVLDLYRQALQADGYKIVTALKAAEALVTLGRERPAVSLVDKNLPDQSGLDLIRQGKELLPNAEFIVVTGYASIDSVIEALDLGAFSYLTKPITDLNVLRRRIRAAVQKNHAVRQNQKLLERLRSAYDALFNASVELDMVNDILEARLADRVAELRAVIHDVLRPLGSVEEDTQKLYAFVQDLEQTGAGGQAGRAKMVLEVVRMVRKRSDELLAKLDDSESASKESNTE